MNVLDGLRYTKEHEWLQLDPSGKTATVGITDFAQESLGDVTFVELPNVGDEIKQNDTFGVVESVKTVSDLYAPCTGKVVEVNEDLVNAPELVNEDPYAKAWMIKVDVSQISEEGLMSPEDYKKFVQENSH